VKYGVLRFLVVAVPVVLVVGILNLVGPGVRTARLASHLPDGYEVLRDDLPDYVIYGRPGSETASRAGEILSRFTRAVLDGYGEMFGLTPPDSRFLVVVFASHDDLAEYGRDHLGADFERNGGFYLPANRTLAVIDQGSFEDLIRALFHEGTHLLLDTWVRGEGHDWSLWLNEGLATWFEESSIRGERVRLGGVGERTRTQLLGALAEGKWIPVPDLLAADPEDFRSEGNYLYYAGSCLLVDFLIRRERRAFAEYFAEERKSGPVRPGAFERIVGDPKEIDGRLRTWLRSGT
jgi:hypothetical protein